MRVVGTAGHVDHGKSALVLALTGIDPDRLREEKERGLTIDLGFAWLTLPNGESVGVVDVPGHRDFIENMLAGVGSIDATLFVVAADESVMPQTREHLAILDLLEIEAGVVAITKIDLVQSEEWLDLVMEDVVDTLAGTVLEDAPLVLTSARTGQGLDRLVEALQDTLIERGSRVDRGRPRLPIDRVFTVSGFGTVVTGTLTDGYLETGQEVEIQPRGLRARIRGLQTHKEKIDRAVPGSRVAVNLSGVDKDRLERGDVVASPGWLHPTTLVDVQMRYLPDVLWPDLGQFAQRPLRHNTALKFYTGAAEVMARVRLLGQKALLPGQVGWVQLELHEPVAMVRGDHYIVRLPSPPTTVGGGIIVDPNPGRKHRRFQPRVTERLETLAEGTPADILLQKLQRQGPVTAGELFEVGQLGEAAPEALEQLLREGRVLPLGSRPSESEGVAELVSGGKLIVTASWWSDMMDRARRTLSSYHRTAPLRKGMPREALRSSLRLTPRVFDAALTRADAEGLIVDEAATVRLPSHRVELTPQQKERVDELFSRFESDPYVTPSVKECVEAVGEQVFRVLVDRGDLVQVSPDVAFLPSTYEEMVGRIQNWIGTQGSITLGEARDMFDSSRKYAQALLEHLDEKGVTKRVGDKRVLR
ncbi:MAG: selenocysteine-specific translation elongation factor [Chloroflexota bacterium]